MNPVARGRSIGLAMMVAVCCALPLGGCFDQSDAAKQTELSKILKRMEAERAEGFRAGYEVGKKAGRQEFEQRRSWVSIGWGFAFGVAAGLCLVGLLSMSRIEAALRERSRGRTAKQLFDSLPPDLDSDAKELANMLAARYAELRTRAERERDGAWGKFIQSVSADVETLMGRSTKLIAVLNELNDSVRKAKLGRAHNSAQAAADSVWLDSLHKAEANIGKCKSKLWATINLIDSVLLRLSNLKLASLDEQAMSQIAAEINQQIESSEQAYDELKAERY